MHTPCSLTLPGSLTHSCLFTLIHAHSLSHSYAQSSLLIFIHAHTLTHSHIHTHLLVSWALSCTKNPEALAVSWLLPSPGASSGQKD